MTNEELYEKHVTALKADAALLPRQLPRPARSGTTSNPFTA